MKRIRTHYDNLKVTRDAPLPVIQASFRALSKQYHPDVNKNPDAARIMTLINEAYGVLSDPKVRHEYDQRIAAAEASLNRDTTESVATVTPIREAKNARRGRAAMATLLLAPLVILVVGVSVKNFISPDPKLIPLEGNPFDPLDIETPAYAAPAVVPIQEGEQEVLTKNERVAPISFETPQGTTNYYIKIIEKATGVTAVTLYVRAGSMYETKVPLGLYEVRYASGHSWYGPKNLFGVDTFYGKLDEDFSFQQSGGEVSGWRVELINQPHGNLRTSKIQPADF
jgi:curved DNA-binding protein CbpA